MKVTTALLTLLSWTTAVYIDKCTQPGKISLHFDNGPHPDNTNLILDALSAYQVKSTFHVSLANIKGALEKAICARIVNEGHQLGYQTESDWNYNEMTLDEFETKIKEAVTYFTNNFSVQLKYIRIPKNHPRRDDFIKIVEKIGCISTDYNLDTLSVPSNFLNRLGFILNSSNPALNSFIAMLRSDLAGIGNVIGSVLNFLKSYSYQYVTVENCVGQNPLVDYDPTVTVRPTVTVTVPTSESNGSSTEINTSLSSPASESKTSTARKTTSSDKSTSSVTTPPIGNSGFSFRPDLFLALAGVLAAFYALQMYL